jgi:hypothetical protein
MFLCIVKKSTNAFRRSWLLTKTHNEITNTPHSNPIAGLFGNQVVRRRLTPFFMPVIPHPQRFYALMTGFISIQDHLSGASNSSQKLSLHLM